MYLCTHTHTTHTLTPQNYLLSIMACHKSTYVCIKFIYKIVITSSQRWNAANFVKTLCSQIIEIIYHNTVDIIRCCKLVASNLYKLYDTNNKEFLIWIAI